MNDHDLDQSYSALCEALAAVGQERAALFLSMVCLSLISRMDGAQQVLPLIAHARDHCRDGADTASDPGPDQSGRSSSG